jgi:spore coat protein JB
MSALNDILPNMNQMDKPNINIDKDYTNDSNLATPYVGYVRGNLFNNLYSGYKNYQPLPLKPRSEQEDLLLSINQLTFAARELNLYLDTHPNDSKMLDLFNKYRKLADEAIKEYESKYAPFNISSSYMKDVPFAWVADPWPWEMEWKGEV